MTDEVRASRLQSPAIEGQAEHGLLAIEETMKGHRKMRLDAIREFDHAVTTKRSVTIRSSFPRERRYRGSSGPAAQANALIPAPPPRRAATGFLFLPPYSPELNPIEINRVFTLTDGVHALIFSKLTSLIRKAAARTHDQPWVAVGRICDLSFDEECCNYFKAAG